MLTLSVFLQSLTFALVFEVETSVSYLSEILLSKCLATCIAACGPKGALQLFIDLHTQKLFAYVSGNRCQSLYCTTN
jgi:hypothetical protein